jgi:ribosomal protein S18 acetylase RimI-like enzyme
LQPLGHVDCEALGESLRKIISAQDSFIFVAETAGSVIGLAEAYLRDDMPNPMVVAHHYIHVQSLIVAGAYRRQGVGEKLLEAVQDWAQIVCAAEIRLETWEFDEGPLHFYEKQHYRTLKRTLVRKIGETP